MKKTGSATPIIFFISIVGGARGNRTPQHSLPYINSNFQDNDVSSPGFGNTSPDRPRSAVPAAKHIKKIVFIMVDTSILIVKFTIIETEDMIRTERAHTLSIQLPTHGLCFHYSHSIASRT